MSRFTACRLCRRSPFVRSRHTPHVSEASLPMASGRAIKLSCTTVPLHLGAVGTGTSCNQFGASRNTGKGQASRTNIPGYEEKPPRARGMCFGYRCSGVGLAAQVKNYIDKEGFTNKAIPLCNTTGYAEKGLTRGITAWCLDEDGSLVLGYYNSNKSAEHSACCIGDTIPRCRGFRPVVCA